MVLSPFFFGASAKAVREFDATRKRINETLVKDPRRVVSTAIRSVFADYVCDNSLNENGLVRPCTELAWCVLGDGPEERALCIDHASFWLASHLKMLQAVNEEIG